MEQNPTLEQRIERRQSLQSKRSLGSTLRDEARQRLLKGHSDLEPEQLASWLSLLDDEDPTPGVSAGAAALAMMDVRDNYMNQTK